MITTSKKVIQLVVVKFVGLVGILLVIGLECLRLNCQLGTVLDKYKGELTKSASYSAPVVTSSNLPA